MNNYINNLIKVMFEHNNLYVDKKESIRQELYDFLLNEKETTNDKFKNSTGDNEKEQENNEKQQETSINKKENTRKIQSTTFNKSRL